MLRVIDTHAHLDELENVDLEISKAMESGVATIVAVGSNHESNLRVLDLSRAHPSFIFPALGLHPCELGGMESSQIDCTLEFVEERISDIIAIGEVGLDYSKRVVKVAKKEKQKQVLSRILNLAKRYKKPVVVHSRYAWKDCFELISEVGNEQVVFHWFTGFPSVLRDILDAGYFISATPAAEYHEEHRQAIQETPLDRLLLETDCPVTYGRENKYRSVPADVLRSLKAVAVLKGIDEAAIAERTTYNAIQLFGFTSARAFC